MIAEELFLAVRRRRAFLTLRRQGNARACGDLAGASQVRQTAGVSNASASEPNASLAHSGRGLCLSRSQRLPTEGVCFTNGENACFSAALSQVGFSLHTLVVVAKQIGSTFIQLAGLADAFGGQTDA